MNANMQYLHVAKIKEMICKLRQHYNYNSKNAHKYMEMESLWYLDDNVRNNKNIYFSSVEYRYIFLE